MCNKSGIEKSEWSKWNQRSEATWRVELSHQLTDSALKGCGVNESGRDSAWNGPAGVSQWSSPGIDS